MEHVMRKKSHTGMVILKDSILEMLATTLVPTMAIPVKTMVIPSEEMAVMSNWLSNQLTLKMMLMVVVETNKIHMFVSNTMAKNTRPEQSQKEEDV